MERIHYKVMKLKAKKNTHISKYFNILMITRNLFFHMGFFQKYAPLKHLLRFGNYIPRKQNQDN